MSTSITMEDLLRELNSDLVKQAEEYSDEEKKEEKKEDAKSEDKDGDSKSEAKKDDEEKEEKEAKASVTDITKQASEEGAAIAREVMSKIASINLEQTPMNKQAQTAGNALAEALLSQLKKQANAGDMTTTDGIAPGAAPSKAQADNAAFVAEFDAVQKPMPTGDGLANHATINEIFDAVIADALAQGAASVDQVHDTGVAKQEGAVEDHAVPNQVKTAAEIQAEDEIEKAAAVEALVESGVSFFDAVELVKQAAEEIKSDMEKSAAMQALMAEGVDFDSAVEMIKQANAGDVTTNDGIAPGAAPSKSQADNAQSAAEAASTVQPMPTGDGLKNGGTINEIFDGMIQRAVAQGAASTDQVHDTGVAKQEGAVEDHAVPNQVKVAAVNKLIEAGYNYEAAVSLVKEASAMSAMKGMAGKAKIHAKNAVGDLKSLATGKGPMAVTPKGEAIKPRATAAGNLARNPVAQAAGAAMAGGAVGSMMSSREKKAEALDRLVALGIDFEKAAQLVEAKSQELFGE